MLTQTCIPSHMWLSMCTHVSALTADVRVPICKRIVCTGSYVSVHLGACALLHAHTPAPLLWGTRWRPRAKVQQLPCYSQRSQGCRTISELGVCPLWGPRHSGWEARRGRVKMPACLASEENNMKMGGGDRRRGLGSGSLQIKMPLKKDQFFLLI